MKPGQLTIQLKNITREFLFVVFQKLYRKWGRLDYWSRVILNFSLGLVGPPHFVYDFSQKNVSHVTFINWPNFIVWLPLLLKILGNMCITNVCWLDCNVIKFESTLSASPQKVFALV